MANKNHALDNLIIDAAMNEFLQKGFERASMRNIAAAADVTIGAIYTRYSTKDLLFCSLAAPLIEHIKEAFGAIKADYYSAGSAAPSFMAEAMKYESDAILHLLFDDYDRAVLLLCKSRGSSLEHFFDSLVEEKIAESLLFFESMGCSMDEGVLKILISSQFHMYFQIINEGYRLEEAKRIMSAAMVYNGGGWLALLSSGENKDAAGGTK